MRRLTIFLTGASGVVGTALRERLRHHRVICLTHRAALPDDALVVRGDLAAPRMGLAPQVWDELARRVDVVVHCAAMTDFTVPAAATQKLNVTGTAQVLELAAAADARLVYLSTAFVARTDLAGGVQSDASADPTRYLTSKRAAEQLVRTSGLAATIVRPSVVVGDSRTGAIASFQGLHVLAGAILRNTLPLLPLQPESRVDFIAQDRLAHAIAGIVDGGTAAAEHWATAGEHALTAREVVDRIVAAGRRLGVDVQPPRLVDPGMVDRLVRPVFVAPLPREERRRFEDMVAITALVSHTAAFPCTLGRIDGCAQMSCAELASALDVSIEHLVQAKGLARCLQAA